MWLGQIWSPLENWILYFMRVQSKFYVQFAARAEIKIPNECFAKWNIKRPTGRNASAAALNEFRMGRTCELATMRQLWHMEALRNRLLLASAPPWIWSELLLFLSLSVCMCLSLSLFLTLSISFSPHSTSGRADKAKEGKLCIIMSSLFPYSHVSVCASACVCVWLPLPVCVCVLEAATTHILGATRATTNDGDGESRDQKLCTIFVFFFHLAQNCCVPRFLPDLLPHPLHLCRTLIRLTHQNRAVKKGETKTTVKTQQSYK